jgi:pyridoxal 5'-phosphate synthase pdxT subunit
VTTVGVLALQGGFEAHLHALARAGADAREIRRVAQLADLRALIVPGGESTTLLNLMADEPWFDALAAFHARGGSLFGTCAGAILLAREVRHPAQRSLGLLDAVVERNAYGRQVDSFETLLDAPALGGLVPGVFIRAPRLLDLGEGVEVLASRRGEPALVRQDRVWAATFHPELANDPRIHRSFVDSVSRVKAA